MASIFKRRRESRDFALRTTTAKITCAREIEDLCAARNDGLLPPQAVSDFLLRVVDPYDNWIHTTANALPADLLERAREWTHLVGEAIPIFAEEGRLNSDQALRDASDLMGFFPEAEAPFKIHPDCLEYTARGAADFDVASGLLSRCYKDASYALANDDDSWGQTVVVATTIWAGWLVSSERHSIPQRWEFDPEAA